MSRFHRQTSYNHKIRRDREDEYTIFWTVDTYVKGSRLRFPRVQYRFTDEAGARRFAKKWGLPFPTQSATQPSTQNC